MSKWMTAKCNLKCSLEVLRRAILGIMPEWEKYIKVSQSGNLTAGGMDGNIQGCSLVIQHGSGTGISYNDIGFKLGEDGTWEAYYDHIPSAIPEKIRQPEKKVLDEVISMKSKLLAKSRGLSLLSEKREGGKIILHHLKKADNPVKGKILA